MRNYKIDGAQSKKLIAIGKAKKDIRNKIAPELLAKYKDALIESIDKRNFSKKDYNEILQQYLKYIKEVLGQYTDRLQNVTMMIKILRKSLNTTTNRKIHSAHATRIGTEIARNLGLNEDLAEVMLIAHDNGHTPYGHDGEEWISMSLREMGLGELWHNAEGVRRILFRGNFYNDVVAKIKESEPDIKEWKLRAIQENLWIILDGILTHNGEATEKKFKPNTSKTEKNFREELLKCYVEKGTDKKLIPATIEGCLLRISDIISYAARDFVDGIREGLINDIDAEYISIFKSFGISAQEIAQIREQGSYLEIAKKIENEAMQDVINNSNGNIIEMSQDMAEKLYLLRSKNNKAIVNKVTRETESSVIPIAIKNIVRVGREELVSDGVINQLEENGEFKITNDLREKYKTSPHIIKMLEFVEGINNEDYNFTSKIADARVAPENGQEVSKEEAVATLIVAQFIADMDDLQFVKYLRESGNLAVEQERDLHVKYNRIPGIQHENENTTKSAFMKRVGEQQDEALKAIMLEEQDNYKVSDDGGRDD